MSALDNISLFAGNETEGLLLSSSESSIFSNNSSVSNILSFSNISDFENSTSGNETAEVPKDDIFRFVTEGILLTVVSIFGLIGNSMSIIVLTRASGVVRQGGASFSKLLRGLATFDALFLFIAIISFGFPQLSRWYTRNVFLYIMPIVFGLLHTFRVGSVYVTLAVTFERFHAIICPLKHFFWKKYLLPASVCVAVIYNIPKYFEMEMQTDPETNRSHVVSTAMRQNPVYVSLYVFWSKFIFIELIPYVTILVLNIFIIIKITKSARFRKQFRRHDDEDEQDDQDTDQEDLIHQRNKPNNISGYCKVLTRLSLKPSQSRVGNNSGESSESQTSAAARRQISTTSQPQNRGSQQPRRTFLRKQQEEHTLGLILIGMSSLFIFCQSFKIIPDLYELVVCNHAGNLGHNCSISSVPVMNIITRMSHLLVCFNSSANFLIYYLNGEKFRRAWVETYGERCCCCVCKTNERSTGTVAMQTLRTEVPVTNIGSTHQASPERPGRDLPLQQLPMMAGESLIKDEKCQNKEDISGIPLLSKPLALAELPTLITVSET